MTGQLRRLFLGSLRRQLILGVALVHAVMMALFVWDLTVRQQAMLLERQTEHATALVQGIATTSASWLAARDYYGLQEIVRTQTLYPDLVYAMIADQNGQILAHSDTRRIGQYLTDLPAQEGPGQATPPGQAPRHARILHHDPALVDVAAPVLLAGKHLGWARVGLGQRTISQRLAAITRDGILYSLAAILIGSLLASLMARRLTRRLTAIQRVADAVQNGETRQRAHIRGDDEAAYLGRAFNAMLDTLNEREGELQRHRDHLAERVAERTAELRRQQVFMEAVLDNINDGVVACDARGRLSYFNRATRRLHGIEQEDLPPERWAEHYRLMRTDGVTPMPTEQIPLYLALRGEEVREQPLVIIHADGDVHHVLCNGQAMHGRDGEMLGAVVSLHDITARKRFEAELIQARDAAEAASRAKSVFLANMSHELRTPLNAILGFAQLLERDPDLPPRQRENLAIVNRSGRHLLGLINEVLEIARIEVGGGSLSAAPCDLPEVLTGVAEALTPRAQGKQLELRLEISPYLPRHVLTDAGKLRQVLLNLLSNAIKFTEHGEVVLAATPLGHEPAAPDGAGPERVVLDIQVRDTGIGIADDELERIFQPFYQTEAGIRQGEGTGLGLPLCREYSRLLGGQLSVESQPGAGTTFSLRLPLSLTDAPPETDSHRRVLGLAPGQASPRILVAEDQPDNRRLIAQLLEPAGFQLRLAGDGREAVALFESWQPDFIWMDMRMPVMDGYAATRAIRALPGGDRVPIVALTAAAFEEETPAIRAAGCDDVLPKPIEADALFHMLARHLDIAYAYAGETDAQPGDTPSPTLATGSEPLDLSTLPDAYRERLYHQAVALDEESLRATLAELATVQPELARSLGALADAYRFDRIAQLLENGPAPTTSPRP